MTLIRRRGAVSTIDRRRVTTFATSFFFTLTTTLSMTSCSGTGQPPQWWKGNLHTHSLWSDGDDYPEMIVDWYKEHGYDFLAFSDHNQLAEGERWIDPLIGVGGSEALDDYVERFGSDWVELRDNDGIREIRLKTLDEFRSLFEERGRFLLIQSEEITDRFEAKPVHLNATNLVQVIPPQGGSSVREVIQNNVDAVLAQRRETGRAMFPHLNHPNFGWAVTPEDIIALRGERFFEVYNGHRSVHNEGDPTRPSTERIWDIVLAERLREGNDVMFGIAVDDAHNYHDLPDSGHSAPGRGWVMVRSNALTPDAIIEAMEHGDFYASSGVLLDRVQVSGNQLAIQIRAEEGVRYRTRFIGTRRNYAPFTDIQHDNSDASARRQYSGEIGIVLAEATGTTAMYQLTGDELYVRAAITSSKLKHNPYREGEFEQAWTQPVVPE